MSKANKVIRYIFDNSKYKVTPFKRIFRKLNSLTNAHKELTRHLKKFERNHKIQL